MKVIKKILSVLVRIVISIILLVLLFRQVDARAILGIIAGAHRGLLVLSFVIFFSTYIICVYRWEMLLKALKVDLPLSRVVVSFSGGIFFNLFLPSTIGGDLIRSLDLGNHTGKPREVVATVFLDRLSGYVGLVLVALAALIFGWKAVEDKQIFIPLIIVVGLLALILFALFNNFLYVRINRLFDFLRLGGIGKAVKSLHQEIYYFRNHKRIIVKNLLLSFLIQLVSPVCAYLIGLALGFRVSPAYYFIFQPIIGAITLLPISIGGLGLRDAMTILFFGKVGVSKDLAFAMSLLLFFFLVVYGAVGGLIYFFTVNRRKLPHAA